VSLFWGEGVRKPCLLEILRSVSPCSSSGSPRRTSYRTGLRVAESARCTKKNLFQKLEVAQGQRVRETGLRVAETVHCTKKLVSKTGPRVAREIVKDNRFQKL
jgi:hypothetical protein